MVDVAFILIVYLVVTAISFWAVKSFFNQIEINSELLISWKIKFKLACIVSAMYLLPLMFFKTLGFQSLLLYSVTIPLTIYAVMKLPQNPIALKTSVGVVWGISTKLIFAIIIIGAIARLLLKFIKG